MDYLTKIKAISKIKISSICKDVGVNRGNLLNGRTTKGNEKKVYDKLIEEYEKAIKS